MAPIRYRDFYDVPRIFVVERDGSLYLFDCSFDDILDEYPDIYRVYRLDPALSATLDDGSWKALADKGVLICAVRIKHVRFDETLRAAVDDTVFERPVSTREELELLIGVLCPGLSAFRARLVARS